MKKRIVSVSRRSDIPAFYAEWFKDSIKKGYCVYPNPRFPDKTYRVDLNPESVFGFVFWTRYAKPMMSQLSKLDSAGYSYYFQYTLVNYPEDIDVHALPLEKRANAFLELADRIGKERVIWRYDPIILNDSNLTFTWHRENFLKILDLLQGHCERLVLSVIDPYAKMLKKMNRSSSNVTYDPDDYCELISWMVDCLDGVGIDVTSCAEPLLHIQGVKQGACIDSELLERISGQRVSKAKHNQRSGCLCARSVDIGVNGTCRFGCKYCYAQASSPATGVAGMCV